MVASSEREGEERRHEIILPLWKEGERLGVGGAYLLKG